MPKKESTKNEMNVIKTCVSDMMDKSNKNPCSYKNLGA